MTGHRTLGSLSIKSTGRMSGAGRLLIHPKFLYVWVMLGALSLGWTAHVLLVRTAAEKPAPEALADQTGSVPPPAHVQAESSQLLLSFYGLLEGGDSDTLLSQSAGQPGAKPMLYLLQAGVFEQKKAATLREKVLQKLELHTQVERGLDTQGKVFYRVMVGPFEDKYSLLSAHRRLTEARVENLLIVMESGQAQTENQ